MVDSVIQLVCECKNDPWGKQGKDSLAARLCALTPGTAFKIDESTTYSEMWMGTYPMPPSRVLSSGQLLQEVLDANKEKLIGKPVLGRFDNKLPFLPKILSIDKALPLQIHPDKDLAARLHEQDPDNYPDDNHKPEIAVALSKFETFVGWKTLEDIQALFDVVEPLQLFLPDRHTRFNDDILRSVCQAMLEASDETIANTQKKMMAIPKDSYGKQSYILELLPRMQKQYSIQDPGCLVALVLMNFLVLGPGDSVYVPADGIHAYLSGDIVECMAYSNNILNTGFCPRADRDSPELFTASLKASPHTAADAILPSKTSEKGTHGKTRVYAPPMSEFNMLVTQLHAGDKEIVKAIEGPSIMIVTSGAATLTAEGKSHDIKTGYIFFIGQGVETTFEAQDGVEIFRAYAE
ncbi:MAG: hypothetical protein M1812_005015 [Candelaria pacifica]|nr:MAG: hypothetical protein M1812_005015 [Candelaria pacifica]